MGFDVSVTSLCAPYWPGMVVQHFLHQRSRDMIAPENWQGPRVTTITLPSTPHVHLPTTNTNAERTMHLYINYYEQGDSINPRTL